jgi:hypothetical protein
LKVVKGTPPNYKDIIKAIPAVEHTIGLVFTYGDTIYSPLGTNIPDNLMVHEQTHEKQQKIPSEWWTRYLQDINFRLEQELEAYKNQYEFYKKKNPLNWFPFLSAIATDLSSNAYGNIITYQEALDKITGKVGFRTETNYQHTKIFTRITTRRR